MVLQVIYVALLHCLQCRITSKQCLTEGPENDEGQSCLYSSQWAVQRGFSHITVGINIAAGAATCQTLCFGPRWVLVLRRMSHANRQFKTAVRLYVSFWCFSCLRTWKQTLVFAFSTSRFFGSPLKVRSWKLKVLTCAGPWVCIWKHLLPPLCNPMTGPLCSILGQRPWQRRALSPVTL